MEKSWVWKHKYNSGQKVRHHLPNNHSKKGWSGGSSGKAPALQAGTLSSAPSIAQNNTKQNKTNE
jgi:hypothetical protein